MSGIDVDRLVLATIATDLDAGAAGLEDLAGSTPSNIDAGPMTGVVASMLSQVVDSAGNASTSMTGAAELVRLSSRYYLRADASSETDLQGIEKAMEQ